MRYDSPELREQLAAEYMLGTMPVLVRRRFERLLTTDATLRRAVEDWNARFDPIDLDDFDDTEEEPPAHVWRAVERRLALPQKAPPRPGWLSSLAFWRAATFAAAALAAAVVIYVGVRPNPAAPSVVAVLSNDKGDAAWIALGGARGGDVDVAPIRSVAIDAAHAFELWAIKDGKPQPLGLLTPEPGRPLAVQASLVPADGLLAISLEPSGGSPTGLPTGPVQYKGAVLPQ
jgi:anti-sigma-K factor RskA